jgi:type I restriction enzyme S subunit
MEGVMERSDVLPKGWKTVQLGDVLDGIVGGGTPSRHVERFWNGDIPWITVKDMRTTRPVAIQEHITQAGVDECATNVIPADTVITATRVGLGKVVRVPYPAAINQDLKALIVGPKLDKSYLEWWILASANHIESIGSGTTVKGIRLNQLKELEIPLAPLPEQRRIVAAIETQLGRLDAALARLHAAKAKLKRYKQAVLKAAVEGPLEDGDFEWITIEEASERIVDCLHSTPKFTEDGKYCIDTTCIEQGVIRFDKARFVTEDSYTDRIRRLKPEAGDVLFAREGTVGTTVVVPEDVDLCLGQRMMMFRLKKSVLPEFFMYVMQSAIMVDKYRPLIIGTTAPHLNIRDIKKFTLPKYPVALQQQIIARLDGTFEVLHEQEATLDAQLLQSTRLRQAVLKRAFEGRLV